MNNQVSTNTPASTLISEEKVVECMKKSRSLREWKIREEQMRFRLGDNFNHVWTKTILLSGVAEEILKQFDEVFDPWESVKISEDSDRIAPL